MACKHCQTAKEKLEALRKAAREQLEAAKRLINAATQQRKGR